MQGLFVYAKVGADGTAAKARWMAGLDQATRDAGDKTPLVIARADGKKPIVIMALDDALPLLRGEVV